MSEVEIYNGTYYGIICLGVYYLGIAMSGAFNLLEYRLLGSLFVFVLGYNLPNLKFRETNRNDRSSKTKM